MAAAWPSASPSLTTRTRRRYHGTPAHAPAAVAPSPSSQLAPAPQPSLWIAAVMPWGVRPRAAASGGAVELFEVHTSLCPASFPSPPQQGHSQGPGDPRPPDQPQSKPSGVQQAARRLTRQIKSCRNVSELQDVVSLHMHRFDFMHISAAITHLAQLSVRAPGHSRSPGEHHLILDALLSGLTQPVLRQMRGREAANVAWALARLGANARDERVAGVFWRAWQACRGMNGQELANALYAAAVMGCRPPQGRAASVLDAVRTALPECGPQAAANMVWALGRLWLSPPPDVVRAVIGATYRCMYDMTPQGLCMCAYGAARLGLKLPRAWRTRLMDAVWRILAHESPTAWTPSGLVQLLWAVARPGHVLPPQWVARLLQEVLPRAPELSAPELASLLWVLVRCRVRPPLEALSQLLGCVAAHLDDFSVEGLGAVAWALAALDARPARPLANRLLTHAFRRRSEMPVRTIVTFLAALPRLGLRPTAKFVQGMLAACQERLGSHGRALDLTMLPGVVLALGHPPPPDLPQCLLALLDARGGELSLDQLQVVLGQLEELGCPPEVLQKRQAQTDRIEVLIENPSD